MTLDTAETAPAEEPTEQRETRGFQTEAKKLLKLMINSLYSNRDVFLRELVSNASDAIDRLRFESLADEALIADDPDFRIVVDFDKDAGHRLGGRQRHRHESRRCDRQSRHHRQVRHGGILRQAHRRPAGRQCG